MSMSLTIAQPPRLDFARRFPHDFPPSIPLAKSRLSPRLKVDDDVPCSLPASILATTPTIMSTPHRGLPPPSAMGLPDPTRQPPPLSQPLGALPAPPTQWHSHHDDLTHDWYLAKAEEQKRIQEEEKTRQESLRLEQRRIEQSMLRDSLQAGIPPSMIPMIYAGVGGANLANVSIDQLHQYVTQLQAAQQHIQQQQHHPSSPEGRRDSRLLAQPPVTYPVQQPLPPVLPSQHVEQSQQAGPHPMTFSAYQPTARSAPTSAPRSATRAQLPRLTTNEMYINPPSQQGSGSAHPLQQSQIVQHDPPTSSPSIYFHHWVPPGESKVNQPGTPASKGEPNSAHPGSHLSESDYKESPRKRKAQGGHAPNPPPSAGPHHTSPSFSTIASVPRRRGHGRSRSNASVTTRDGRPNSRRGLDVLGSPPPSTDQVGGFERISLSRGEPASRSSAGSSGERESRHERPGS